MSLVQLIYVSAATEDWSAEELQRILASAVKHNTRNGITGLLLYARQTFMQVLEGPEAAVEETLARIRRDPRNANLAVLSRSRVAARDFGRWAMAVHPVDAADARAWPGFAPLFQQGFDPATVGARPGLAFDILTALATAS